MLTAPRLQLNDGNTMPSLGLGLWRVEDADAPQVVREAVTAGYRLFDTAAMYGNERGVGQGVREASIDRRDLFLTTKVWNDRHGYDATMAAFDESLARLGLEYVDCYLIHWPVAAAGRYLETWKALLELRRQQRVRSVGVGNFLERHLEVLVGETGEAPALNQIEYHPLFQQPTLERANTLQGIVTQAWAPLGRGAALEHPTIRRLAEKYGKTPVQIILRWHLDGGRAVIPKTVRPERMRENSAVFDFTLTIEETAAIDAIGTVNRTGGDPETYTGREA
ncbi:MAG: aldo/keto reductase [Planctomycetes bacterium]|nr:aldo/keto reductase [Planctomycetota bacterium]